MIEALIIVGFYFGMIYGTCRYISKRKRDQCYKWELRKEALEFDALEMYGCACRDCVRKLIQERKAQGEDYY